MWINLKEKDCLCCEYNLRKYFEKTNDFIEKHLKKNNILIYSSNGYEYSTCILLAYFMNKNQWLFKTA